MTGHSLLAFVRLPIESQEATKIAVKITKRDERCIYWVTSQQTAKIVVYLSIVNSARSSTRWRRISHEAYSHLIIYMHPFNQLIITPL